jgi:predicted regulator of Ras-like GTPase activity (Roadblock/LC7/MglB family)
MTPTLARRAGAVTLIAATAAALAGCGGGIGARLTYDDTEKVKVSEIVLTGGGGDVTVTTAAVADTRIKRIVRTDGSADPQASYQLTGTVLTLDTSCGHQCQVSYEIQAPTGVAVRGRLGSGELSLTDIATADVTVGSGNVLITRASGAVSLKSGSGQIEANDLGAEATLVAGSGNIEAHGLSGGKPVRLQTGSGEITAELTRAASVTARTGSGNVELMVPDGAYRVKTHHGSGDAELIGLSDDPQAKNQIDVQTGSGNATITALPGS